MLSYTLCVCERDIRITNLTMSVKSQIARKSTSKQKKNDAQNESELDASQTESSKSKLEEIPCNIQDLKDELKNMLKKDDIEKLIEKTVAEVMKSLENKMREEIKREIGVKCGILEDELKLLEFENGKLREKLESQSKLLDERTKELETKLAQQEQKNNDSIKMANQNEQYFRKNNVKIMNIEEGPGEDEEKLTKKVCTILQHQGVQLLKEEIIAIHRLPTKSMSH